MANRKVTADCDRCGMTGAAQPVKFSEVMSQTKTEFDLCDNCKMTLFNWLAERLYGSMAIESLKASISYYRSTCNTFNPCDR